MVNEQYEQQRANYFNSLSGTPKGANGTFRCEICKDKGYIDGLEPNIYGDMVNHVMRECKCRKKQKILDAAECSGLDGTLQSCTFKTFEANEEWQKGIKATAQAFCEDERARCFYIGGQSGCGKTHICTAIFGTLIKKGFKALYMRWEEESRKLKAITNDMRYEDLIRKYKDTPVLYIDDFLKVQSGGAPTEADIKLAFNLINSRYMDNNKITIISSEKTLDELLRYDEATMGRIVQMAGKYQLEVKRDKEKNYRTRRIK